MMKPYEMEPIGKNGRDDKKNSGETSRRTHRTGKPAKEDVTYGRD
jgi:hypothetical protein